MIECYFCEELADRLDWKIPPEHGGTRTKDNIADLCATCADRLTTYQFKDLGTKIIYLREGRTLKSKPPIHPNLTKYPVKSFTIT